MRKTRLAPEVFKLPIEQLQNGYYSDKYFVRTTATLAADGRNPIVLYQFFIREAGVLSGIDEAIAILKLCCGPEKWAQLKVKALYDGENIEPWVPFMTIEGPAQSIAHLETPLLGVIARGIKVATAVKKAAKAANGKALLFFPARFDHYRNQASDGYAAMVAGATSASTDANTDWWGQQGVGTVPHALIACYGGDTAAAAVAFDKYTDPAVNRVILVDWKNDCVETTKEVVHALSQEAKFYKPVIGAGKGKLWGVRFDTSGTLRDRIVDADYATPYGVNPQLVARARQAFDAEGWRELKIVVSGGFTEEKIADFERRGLPVDAYGVGSSLLKHNIDVTADIVVVDGKECHKVGRPPIANPLLEDVE